MHILHSVNDLDAAATRSHEHSIVIFKHSTTCGRSAMALQEVEDLVARDPSADVSTVCSRPPVDREGSRAAFVLCPSGSR